MPYGTDRDEPIRRADSRPRGITERHAKLAKPTRTVLDEPGPETNRDPGAQGSLPAARGVRFGGGAVPVEATRTEPTGVAVVEVPGELDRPDDDSHVVVDTETGEAELVEVEPVDDGGRGDGRPVGSLPEPEGGEAQATTGAVSTATPGTPGSIDPEITPRPATLLELAEAVQPGQTGEPWPAGTFVLYGAGKRAHWNGEAWRSGEAPSAT